MKLEAILLLGPTGSGKTPLGDWLEQTSLWGRRCHHFDFGANLRAVVDGELSDGFMSSEIGFLRRVLAEGALLEDQQFPLAARILEDFVRRKQIHPKDLIVLNGLPRHVAQARAIDDKLEVIAVVELECDGRTVAERLRRNSGGDRAGRDDDVEALVARKLATYAERTRPLLEYYRSGGVPLFGVEVSTSMKAGDLAQRLGAWNVAPGTK